MSDDGGDEAAGVDDASGAGVEGRNFSALERSFRQMMEDKFIDGLVRRFEKLFPDHSAEVEDVLLEEVVRLVESTGAAPRNIRAVLTWRLRKRMLDVAKRPTLGDWEEPVERDTPERHAIRKEMFDHLKALLDTWENHTMALVVRLTLVAAYYDEVLEVDDVKEIVFEQLGHDLTTANVWKLRSRGLKRLAADVIGLLGEYAEGWEVTPVDEEDDNQDDIGGPIDGAEEE